MPPHVAVAESERAYAHTVQQLFQEDRLLADPLLADRVGAITGRLVAAAQPQYPKARDWRWTVALIDEPGTINAWCMAGGRMAIYSGLIDELELDDDELAQIIGHEMAHALANHTAEAMSVALATRIGTLATVVATDRGAGALSRMSEAAQLAIELPKSRAAETEADRIGMELAARAGYLPQAGVSLWDKMHAAGGPRPPRFLSTHPSPGSRRARLKALAPSMRALMPAVPPRPAPVAVLYKR